MFSSLPPRFWNSYVLLGALASLLFFSPKSQAKEDDRIVILISVDGAAGFYLNDPKAHLPTIGQLAKEGASADTMVASLPTVTWPNHTTLVTGVSPGKHGVMGNSYWDRKENKVYRLLPDQNFNKDEIVKAPTVYDVLHAAGLKTAGINWPASRGADSLDWRTPDVFSNEIMQKYTTPSLLEEIRRAGIPIEKQELWCKTDKGRERDMMYTQILIHTINQHAPNFALLHLVEVDHVEHATGPRSEKAYEAMEFEDGLVKQIWDAAQKKFPGKATILVTSDHGFVAVRQKIQPNVVLRNAGLLKVENGKMIQRRAFALDQGGSTFIYIVDQAHKAEIVQQITALFKNVEGIDLIVGPNEYAKHGLIAPEKDDRMADMVLTAKDGYAFSDKVDDDVIVTPKSDKTSGAHGHNPAIPDMKAMFVASGNGIRSRAHVKEIDNRDVAPTAAKLLGIEMKDVEGRVLKEFLAK